MRTNVGTAAVPELGQPNGAGGFPSEATNGRRGIGATSGRASFKLPIN